MHILLVEMRLDNIKGICCLKATKNSKRQGIMKLILDFIPKTGPTIMKLQSFAGKACILASTMIIGSGFLMGTAHAQEEEVLEEIVTTGSRLARDPNLAGALPVQSLTAEDIQLSGEFTVADVINDVPALLTSTTNETSADSGLGVGSNVLALRGMGSNRTLVLVDGRRHVGGQSGSSAVDVGSIPMNLVERVEVLTGGASAIYGADAVTGVVNFIMKKDFEGVSINYQVGESARNDAIQTALSASIGKNFAGGRGNITLSLDYRTDDGLRATDRVGGDLIGTADDWTHPDKRFQIGDILPTTTPHFADIYHPSQGNVHFGMSIPTEAAFLETWAATFDNTITLTGHEKMLIAAAAAAPTKAILPSGTFSITSGYGYVTQQNDSFGNYGKDYGIDIDGNGVSDVYDSFSGWNGTFGYGNLGGTWNIAEDGTYAPVVDGIVAGNFNGWYGDSSNVYQHPNTVIIPSEDKMTLNLMGHYDVNDSATFFFEAKNVSQDTQSYSISNSFWDLIYGYKDNPYLPAFLQPVLDDPAGGYVHNTIDPINFNDRTYVDRETSRAVIGLEGEFDNGWNYEVSYNYGRYQHDTRGNEMINDRWFAATDAITNSTTGAADCRVNTTPTAPAQTTPYGIPAYEAGYWSFTAGDGTCQPINIWGGKPGMDATAAGMAWVTTPTWSKLVIDQKILAAHVTGELERFSMPGGPIQFAIGMEYREESSDASFDAWQRGVIPAGAPNAGKLISTLSSTNTSLTFRPNLSVLNEVGKYDSTDVFIETSFPLLRDAPAARELTLDFAARAAEYSTVGDTMTWKSNIIYAPVSAVTFRGTFSEAVRAPNITELFGPMQGQNYRPTDPCDIEVINAVTDASKKANFLANCTADLLSIGKNPLDASGAYVFTDPLSASFGGLSGGNKDLNEETADTTTFGVVIQPEELLPGFSLTIDFWDISIEGAIQQVSAQNIVDGCYQGTAMNMPFCNLFTRDTSPTSNQFGGFYFLQSSALNFAKVESSGVDFAIKYGFDMGDMAAMDITVSGTQVDELNFYEDVTDMTQVNPELTELHRPEVAGNVFANLYLGDKFRFGYQAQYIGEMLLNGAEVETYKDMFGEVVMMDPVWMHDMNARYLVNDSIMVYAGIRNMTDEKPFITQYAFPASARGRYFYSGVDVQF